MTDTCSICCFDFTTLLRKKISCNFCKFEVCTKCVKTYLLNSYKDPHCMKCNVGWNRDFIDDNLSKSFRSNELKLHRSNVLIDREKSLLPSTIPNVEIELAHRKNQRDIMDLNKQRNVLMQQIRDLDLKIHDKMYNDPKYRRNTNTTDAVLRVYNRPCPTNDCRGYLSNWKCSICEIKVCSKCYQIENENHECKQEDVDTANLLKKDTKFCPNESCKTPIYKIEGCSQMFCTVCNTAFDWKTGEIIKNQNAIHNPHYYEWLRKQNNGVVPRNVGDIPCGGLPGIWNLQQTLRSNQITVNLDRYHRGLNHFINYEIPRLPIDRDNADYFIRLRVRYLLNELDEESWKKELHKTERKREKNIAFRNIFDMLVNVGTDLFTRIMNCKKNDQVYAILKELENLRLYFNESLYKVTERFDSKAFKEINKEWVFCSIRNEEE